MYYFQDDFFQSQAGLALRIGKLLNQYKLVMPSDQLEQYDATLLICCLHNLLVNTKELLDVTEDKNKGSFLKNVVDVPNGFGIRQEFVKENTYFQKLTNYQFIKRLRNALSHPFVLKDSELPQTGYESIHKDNKVFGFRFITSPAVEVEIGNDGKPRRVKSKFSSDNESELNITLKKKSFHDCKNHCDHLKVKKDSRDGLFKVYKEDEIYLPVFIAEIPLNDLYDIAINLANYLAQGSQDYWDGKTIRDLVA